MTDEVLRKIRITDRWVEPAPPFWSLTASSLSGQSVSAGGGAARSEGAVVAGAGIDGAVVAGSKDSAGTNSASLPAGCNDGFRSALVEPTMNRPITVAAG